MTLKDAMNTELLKQPSNRSIVVMVGLKQFEIWRRASGNRAPVNATKLVACGKNCQ
jgi:hypothetical protein